MCQRVSEHQIVVYTKHNNNRHRPNAEKIPTQRRIVCVDSARERLCLIQVSFILHIDTRVIREMGDVIASQFGFDSDVMMIDGSAIQHFLQCAELHAIIDYCISEKDYIICI